MPDAQRRWSWESLRYRSSGWWLDAAPPRSPLGLLIIACALPPAWFAAGYGLTAGPARYLATHDVSGQLWFFPLRVIVGSQWASHLGPALDGLALDAAAQRRVRRTGRSDLEAAPDQRNVASSRSVEGTFQRLADLPFARSLAAKAERLHTTRRIPAVP